MKRYYQIVKTGLDTDGERWYEETISLINLPQAVEYCKKSNQAGSSIQYFYIEKRVDERK